YRMTCATFGSASACASWLPVTCVDVPPEICDTKLMRLLRMPSRHTTATPASLTVMGVCVLFSGAPSRASIAERSACSPRRCRPTTACTSSCISGVIAHGALMTSINRMLVYLALGSDAGAHGRRDRGGRAGHDALNTNRARQL